MKTKRFLICAGLMLAAASVAWANVTLAPLFCDGAVLQRDKPLPVWGRAAPGETVRVRFHAQSVATTAAPDGRWAVTLAAEKTSARPSELVVTGENTVRVRDVLVGDVWLCSGQSNMEFTVSRAQNAAAEIAAARYPFIRQFKVAHASDDAPAATAAGRWVACGPETAGDFSAVAYFFARDLYAQSRVPVGLINSSWGGTYIEAWMSRAALGSNPAFAVAFTRWQEWLAAYPERVAAHAAAVKRWEQAAARAKADGRVFKRRQPLAPEGPGGRNMPAGLFNGMIHPLIPYALRGVVWYQGEQNGDGHPLEYRALFPAMIRQWRADFGQGDLPFYFVQLPNCLRPRDPTGAAWAWLREAQSEVLTLPNTAMAVTIDVGDPHNIHPKNKQEVGRRLALLVRAHLWGEAVASSGPVFQGVKREGGALRIEFAHAAGLTSRGAPLIGFEIAGADRRFVPALARIDGETVVVQANAVSAPVAVRYAWSNSPTACLFNSAGLPAAPFRSDQW